jgi:hypothetical protein
MQKVIVSFFCCIFFISSFCFAADTKKVDNPTIEMLQGTWEGTFTRRLTARNSSGQFEIRVKGKKAFVTRAAIGTDSITQWVVAIDKIDQSKIFMSSKMSEFELQLYTNDKAEFFLEGDYTGRKADSMKSQNSSLKLQKTSATVDEKKIPVGAAKEWSNILTQ